jgi:hypothetical protein
MMMKMLEAGGLQILTDNQRVADDSNPKGYYEFERVKKLKEGDFDWLPQAHGKVVKVISALLEFLPGRYSYKIIFMRRDMNEILSSQTQMLKHDGKPSDQVTDQKMAELYAAHLKRIEDWLAQQPNMRTLWVSYNQTLKDPQATVTQLNSFLDSSLNTVKGARAEPQFSSCRSFSYSPI